MKKVIWCLSLASDFTLLCAYVVVLFFRDLFHRPGKNEAYEYVEGGPEAQV